MITPNLLLALSLYISPMNAMTTSDATSKINDAMVQTTNVEYQQKKKKTKVVEIKSLPTSLEELQAMDGADLKDEFKVAALVVAVLCNYEKNMDATFEMLEFLNGPNTISKYDKEFIRDRLKDKQYKTFSFFEGTSPQNNYTTTAPYKIKVSTNPYSYQVGNYVTLWLDSSGSDNPRPIKLRKKPSTGQWFVNDITFLSDIRIPVAQDEWN